MSSLTIQLPDEFSAETDIKIIYDQYGHPREVLLPYDTFYELVGLLRTLQGLPKAEADRAEWQNKLLTLSTWSDEEIEALKRGRDLINQWQPQTFGLI